MFVTLTLALYDNTIISLYYTHCASVMYFVCSGSLRLWPRAGHAVDRDHVIALFTLD